MNFILAQSIQDVPRETTSRLEQYVALLLKWNNTINLIGKTTADNVWDRHIIDCLQLVRLIPAHTESLVDLGSGAGLPGLVIACCLPELAVTLVERDHRKAAFLLQAAQTLDLKHVNILAKPIEEMTSRFDVVTARALTSLSSLCEFAHPLLGVNAICLFPKGADFAKELEQAQQHWQFAHALHRSITNEKSYVIMIKQLTTLPIKGHA